MTTISIAEPLSDKLVGSADIWAPFHGRQDISKPIIVEFSKAPAPGLPIENEAAAAKLATGAIHARQDAILGALFASSSRRAEAMATSGPEIKRLDHFPLFAMVATGEEIAQLAENPLVVRIYEDVPHEPKLNAGHAAIGMPLAYTMGATGEGFHVAVLDTGARRTHDFLRNKVVAAACFSSNRMAALPDGGIVEYRTACPDEATSLVRIDAADDCVISGAIGCGHGTMVAGIAAGVNSGTTMPGISSGVARASKIISVNIASYATKLPGNSGGLPVDSEWMPCPGLTCMRALSSDVLRGLDYIYGLRNTMKIAAVSVSFGQGSHTAFCNQSPFYTVIGGLRAANIATIVPAGDDGNDSAVSSPGCIPLAITVAASAGSSARLESSNWGSLVDLVAPGSGLFFPVPANNSNAEYRPGSGTSIATAFVAGAFAAIRSKRPNADVSDILSALQRSGRAITSAGTTRARIDVPEALNALGGVRIVAAITPVARRGVLNQPITAFATVISPPDSTGPATGCLISRPPDGLPYGFAFAERLLPGSGLGSTNAAFTLAPGQARHFLLAFNAVAPVSSHLQMTFDCVNTLPAETTLGLNTFNLVATATPGADILATAVTPTNDGIIRLPVTAGGGNVAAMAGTNIGIHGTLQAWASTVAIGSSSQPLTLGLLLCQTNPTTGLCLNTPTSNPITFNASPNQVFTFTAFANYQGTPIALDPAKNRVYIHFREGATNVGSASVAVTTDQITGEMRTVTSR